MKNLSAKFDITFNWLRCIVTIFYCLIISFIFIKPLDSCKATEFKQFNRNLKNYNVKLQILNQNQEKVAQFATAIADDDRKRTIGLMHLKTLPQNHAMLFTFKKNHMVSMWMKNTSMPLDMLFIDKNNIIVTIKTNNTPYSLQEISSEKPVNKILEINAGLSEKLGLKIGYKIKIN